jgi:hypothetical protein
VGNLDEALEECRKLAERHHIALPTHTPGQIRKWIEAGRAAYAADKQPRPK